MKSKNRRSRIIAWGLSATAVLGGVVLATLWASHVEGRPSANQLVDTLGLRVLLPMSFSVLAALIISHSPDNRTGWLMMVSALGSVIPAETILRLLPSPPSEATLGIWLLLWVDNLSWVPIFFPIFLIPLHFPSGRPPSARWNWVNHLAIGLALFLVLTSVFVDQMLPVNLDYPALRNPLGFIPLEFFDGPVFLVPWGVGLLTVVAASIVSLFVRHRNTDVREKQQIKWLLFAGGLFFVVFLIMLVLPPRIANLAPIGIAFTLAILGIPVAIAVAIFRYRLWDLDVVINRALIYGPLTTFLAGTFAMVIALTTELTKEALGDQSKALGAALSAVIVAVFFQPLRDRIEAFVDKRFYPQKLDLASGLVEVAPEYWSFLDRETLMNLALGHVSNVLGTMHAAFYLAASADRFELAAGLNGADSESPVITLSKKQLEDLQKKRVVASDGLDHLAGHVPLFIDRGKSNELLGLLSVGSRTNGKGYSGDDLKGLVELGSKIGLALNAIRMAEKRMSSEAYPMTARPASAQS